MRNRYFVVDDFYANPDELMQSAIQSLGDDGLRGNFAGVMTPKTFLTPKHMELFRNLLHEPTIASSTELNGKIRFTMRDDSFVQHIHFDGGLQTNWSGVIYLSRNHPKIDGTNFWKHKATGLEEMPRSIEELARHGWRTSDDIRLFLEQDGVDYSKWEKVMTVPYKFNRLVLFRPWVFHSPGDAFGDSLESSRVVQTLFLGNKQS